MFDDGFFFLILLVIVIAVAVRVIRGILFVRNFSRSKNDIEALLTAIHKQIASASSTGGVRRPAGGMHQPPPPQLMAMMLQYRNQMAQLDQLHQAQYDVRMGELQSMAANAGIDWTPTP